ncbi:hypothetical protein [Helicobacter canis]|uniref:Uncharacterized protein n=1 Tax=Helicobacter canis NCTC 12740 TaxID=1357399 RepID=V8CJA4_9HELI|nr:hypothetical protein [Helicobacter canis]ETD27463.1 hypothetical protein HMPREF2087_00381 [Helicobacter canis NCTC 12740]
MSSITSTSGVNDPRAMQELFLERTNLRANQDLESQALASKLEPRQSPKELESSTNTMEKDSMLGLLSALAPAKSLDKTQGIKGLDDIDSSDKSDYKDPYDSLHRIQDTFTPSKELSAAMNAKAYVKNGLADVDSFKSMAKQLQADGVLNRDDMMAVDFLSAKAPHISFQDFDAMIKNDNLSREMRSLISQLVQKLHMVNYISGGLMSA